MRKGSFAVWAPVIGLAFHLGGCADLPERGAPRQATLSAAGSLEPKVARARSVSSQASAPAPAAGESVVAAVATTEGQDGPSPVRWTAGVVADSAAAVKQGVNDVTQALTPAPPVAPSDDPVQMSTKAKPTPELYAAMARFYEQSGKPAMAERTYRRAVQLWPTHLGLALNYARFKDRQGSTQEAFQLYQSAAKQHPNEAVVFNDAGLFFARQGRNRDAVWAFERAIQLQPKRPLYRNNLAALLVDMDQPDKAMAQLTAVYGEAEASYNLGYLLQKKGRSKDAAALFAKALRINPQMAEARAWLDYLEGNRTPPAQVARRPMGSEPTSSANSYQPPQPSILRDGNPESQVGPRAGPRSAPGWRKPGDVRPLPPPVTPLPSVNEEDSARPPEARATRSRSAEEPPLPGSAEPWASAREAQITDEAPDAPLPSDSGPWPRPSVDDEAPRSTRPLPPVP